MTKVLKNGAGKMRIIIILVLLFLLIPFSTKVYGTVTDSGSCGANATYEFEETTGTLTVDGVGQINNYDESNPAPWGSYSSDIEIIIINEGITSIGENNFDFRSQYATIPDSVQSIASTSFSGATYLLVNRDSYANTWASTNHDRVIVAEDIETSGSCGDNVSYTFDLSSKTLNITGTGAMTDFVYVSGSSISNAPWASYSRIIDKVIISDGVTRIGDNAFNWFTTMHDAFMPNSVEEIGLAAFGQCYRMDNLILSNKLKKIGDFTFCACRSMEELIIPNSVNEIGSCAFEESPVVLIVSENSYGHTWAQDNYADYRIYVSNISGGEDITYEYNGETKELFINGTGEMNDFGNSLDTQAPWLEYRGSIETVVISEGITNIGEYAFSGCENLKNVYSPESLTEMGDYAFLDCDSLKMLYIPESVNLIGTYAVNGCTDMIYLIYIDSYAATWVRNNNYKYVETMYYDAEYDGEYHSITVNSSEEITVTYNTEGYDSEYTSEVPRYKDPLVTNVYYKVEIEGREPILAVDYIIIRPSNIENIKADLYGKYGHDDVKLQWDSVAGASGYNIYYAKENDEYFTFSQTTSELVAYCNNLYDGKKYLFLVTPFVEGYDFQFENLEGKTAEVITLKKVNTPYISKNSDNYVKIKWTNIEGESGYQISRSTSSTGTYIVSTYYTTTGTYKTLKTTRYKGYYYKVRAFKTVDGEKVYGPWSETRYFNLGPAIVRPGAPSYVNARLNGGYDDVKITWGRAEGADGYYVYYKSSTASDYTYLGSTTNRYYYKKDLFDGKKYYFKIVPYTVVGGYKYKSNSYKTDPVYTLKKITTPYISESSYNYVKVKWTNISGESGYQISRSTSPTGTYIVSTYATTGGNYRTLKTTRFKDYYYKVRAYIYVDGKRIYGPWSEVRYFKLGPAIENPPAPSNVYARLYGETGHDDVKVTWSEVKDADGYYVYYKLSTSSSYTYLGRTTNTYIYKNNLYDGKKYYFKIVPYTTVGGLRYKSSHYKTDSVYTLKKMSAPKVTAVGDLKIAWSKMSGASGYVVLMGITSNVDEMEIISVTDSTLDSVSFDKTGIIPRYYYFVTCAYRKNGEAIIVAPFSEATKIYLK